MNVNVMMIEHKGTAVCWILEGTLNVGTDFLGMINQKWAKTQVKIIVHKLCWS
jgi:hypothetical protein